MSKRFAEFLLREGYINPEHLQEADENFKAKKESYVLFLATKGYIDENRIAEVFSKRYGLTKLDLSKHQIKENIAELIPKELIFKYRVIPLQKNKNTLVVATYDPTVLAELDDLKFRLKMSLHAVITPVSSFFHALENNFSVGFGETFDEFADENNDVEELDGGTDYFDVTVASDGTDEDAPVIKFVNSMLANSVKKGASDIHLEPYEKAFRLRFRVDGELREITKIPPKMKAPVISRLKIMSKMDIGERRLPQDGRIKIRVGNKDVDFRVSSIPVQWGEKIVLRILDKAALQLDLKKLGFEKDQLLTFKNGIIAPFGMILVTGPTGSGKTTTLYSALQDLNKVSENISTIEDPIEYNLEGINQCEYNKDINFVFTTALKAFLRQDPDIILVGEIRDLETCEVAVQAALTGHLLLSTIHTNDAPSTVARMLNMGIQPVMLSSALHTVVAQRLLRKICTECKEQVEPPVEQLINLGVSPESANKMKVYKGKGCSNCSETGYRGRIAIYEVMYLTNSMKNLILKGGTTPDIKQAAIENGMKTLRMSALIKVARGETTLEEAVVNTASDL